MKKKIALSAGPTVLYAPRPRIRSQFLSERRRDARARGRGAPNPAPREPQSGRGQKTQIAIIENSFHARLRGPSRFKCPVPRQSRGRLALRSAASFVSSERKASTCGGRSFSRDAQEFFDKRGVACHEVSTERRGDSDLSVEMNRRLARDKNSEPTRCT